MNVNDFENTKVSIILPVNNGERFLSDSIKSILNQTHTNWELIIVNDCSTDGTLKIISEFALNDSRILIINNDENKKLPASLNIGHKIASGDYISWTSDDNIYQPFAFSQYLKYLNDNQCDIVYSDFDLINSEGQVLKRRTLLEPENLINGNYVGASFLYKREVFESLDGYNENLFLVEDYDFWLRAFTKFKFKYIPDSLYFYRTHAESLSSQIVCDSHKNILWRKNVYFMYENFLSHYTLENKWFASFFTNQLTHQPFSIDVFLNKKKEFLMFINKIASHSLVNENNIRLAFKEKLIHLLVNNHEKKHTYKLSYLIIIIFCKELRKNDLKKLLKYSFFK